MTIRQRYHNLPIFYKWQLYATFISGYCYSISYGVITKVIYSSVEVDVLTIRLLLSATIGLLLSFLWLGKQEKLYKNYVWYATAECVLFGCMMFVAIGFQDYDKYLLMETFVCGTIGTLVSGGNHKIHQEITDDVVARTDYEYFSTIFDRVALITGSSVAFVLTIHFAMAFAMSFIGMTITNIVMIMVYKRLNTKH